MNTEQQIEFNKIKEIWAELAVTGSAKEEIENVSIFLDELELNKKLRDTTNSRKMIENLGNPPLQDVTEIREILMEAGKGACLTPYQLERVEKVLVVVERLKDYLARGKQYENPLAYYDENLDELKEVLPLFIKDQGPVFLNIDVDISSRKDLGRPTTTPNENKNEFKKRLGL
jgi:dsDNA-specific endonuclease/ATPase MutS2